MQVSYKSQVTSWSSQRRRAPALWCVRTSQWAGAEESTEADDHTDITFPGSGCSSPQRPTDSKWERQVKRDEIIDGKWEDDWEERGKRGISSRIQAQIFTIVNWYTTKRTGWEVSAINYIKKCHLYYSCFPRRAAGCYPDFFPFFLWREADVKQRAVWIWRDTVGQLLKRSGPTYRLHLSSLVSCGWIV